MMPYQTYQLYQIERPKSAAEIRRADEQLGRAAAWMSQRLRQAAERMGISRAPIPSRAVRPARAITPELFSAQHCGDQRAGF
jgi:hypothetical protein